jgi:hypothetical protein
MMTRKALARLLSLLTGLVICGAIALAADISGTISTPLNITEDSKLVGDVNCTVTGVPCIRLGASNITLDLNGFTLTGLGDADTGCRGGPTAFAAGSSEDGVFATAQRGNVIRGPGLIQRFRGAGIFLNSSNAVTVTGVTASTNCLSGILIIGGSEHEVRDNVSIRNGNGTFPCGGI